MYAFGVRVGFETGSALVVLGFVALGVALGTVSGLTPGLHVNTLAVLLAAAAPALPGPARGVAVAILAAGVVHSILDVVPALALGVPDTAMAPSTLPGHRLVLAGRGREALRLSALGSGAAALLACLLGWPITRAIRPLAPLLREHLTVVLAAVVVFLVLTEASRRQRIGACAAFACSGVFGVLALDQPTDALLGSGDLLMPAFAGLFGLPVLVAAARGGGPPAQADAAITTSPRRTLLAGLAGAAAGAAVSYVAGVSSAVAAVVALAALPARSDGDRAFLVATSGVNTSNTIFALFAFVALDEAHTGVVVALDRSAVPLDLPLYVVSLLLAAALGVVLVLVVGDRYLDAVRVLPHRGVCLVAFGVVCALALVLAGPIGLAVLAAGTLVGFVPVHFGARRVHLMGVLIVPIVLAA
ncbi:tripartite tricarboxylate transporter permease [Halarchaeum sp. CBA1220]|uniref:tripartite tricarboxylate transporter permease n=1 Tax=Halarchaeum sp. CBA1220 TaxID=1853682 RepID=UPI000F3AA17F|nr:tripartite tricarboxylate transporter permease [Halarchaeum sp. CBA1220]QLC34377.1 tripartite tricarboxylate transporter permease [Halarchaeum sp. CBA1220]